MELDDVIGGGPARLFRSDVPRFADGARKRDFIWVGDVVTRCSGSSTTQEFSGLFNIGTGGARTYLGLAYAVCDAAGVARRVEFIDIFRASTQSLCPRQAPRRYAPPATPPSSPRSRKVYPAMFRIT